MNIISKEQLAKARVLVVGDPMLDRYWHGAVERISPEAPVPVVKVNREEERIGAAANVAYNVVTLGARASFLGVVGDDEAILSIRITGVLGGVPVEQTMWMALRLRDDRAFWWRFYRTEDEARAALRPDAQHDP